MQSYYTFIALDIAAERSREADRQRLAAEYNAAYGSSRRSLRHGAAVVFGSFSRATASIASFLDDRSEDDEAASASASRYAASH